MRISGISIMLLFFLLLLVLQSVGGMFQIRDYRQAVRRVHRLGNVGIGQKRGWFLNGHIVIIACDKAGTITGAEAMDGISIWARFHPVTSFAGKKMTGCTIYELLDMAGELRKRQFNQYQGYIRALEALEVRLTDRELTREQDRALKKRSGRLEVL